MGGQHLGWFVGEVHGVHWGAVEFVKIEALGFAITICNDFVFLHSTISFYAFSTSRWAFEYREEFELVVTGVDCVLIITRVGEELTAVDSKGKEGQGEVGVFGVGAVLPLDDTLWALGIGG